MSQHVIRDLNRQLGELPHDSRHDGYTENANLHFPAPALRNVKLMGGLYLMVLKDKIKMFSDHVLPS